MPRPRDTAYEDFERNIRRPIQLRVFNFLKQWTEKQGTELLDGPGQLSSVGKQIDDFARTILAEDDPKLAKQLLGSINKLVRARSYKRSVCTRTAAHSQPREGATPGSRSKASCAAIRKAPLAPRARCRCPRYCAPTEERGALGWVGLRWGWVGFGGGCYG